jgi:hypothetical protein
MNFDPYWLWYSLFLPCTQVFGKIHYHVQMSRKIHICKAMIERFCLKFIFILFKWSGNLVNFEIVQHILLQKRFFKLLPTEMLLKFILLKWKNALQVRKEWKNQVDFTPVWKIYFIFLFSTSENIFEHVLFDYEGDWNSFNSNF